MHNMKPHCIPIHIADGSVLYSEGIGSVRFIPVIEEQEKAPLEFTNVLYVPSLSSTEAEYMSLSDTSRQLLWIKSLMSELGIDLSPIPLFGDNQGSIFLASNPVQEKCIKHIDLRYHFICNVVQNKQVELFFIEGASNPADLFTKNLGHVKFQKFM